MRFAYFFGMLSLVSIASQAQESRFYLGTGLGSSQIKFNSEDFDVQGTVPSVSTESSRNGTKVFAGYRLDNQVALELAYTDFGKFRYRVLATTGASYKDNVYTVDYATEAWSASLKGNVPVTQRLSLFGRVGATWNVVTNTFEIDSSRHVEPPIPPSYVAPKLSNSAVYAKPGRSSESRTALQLGLGLEYQAWESVSLRLEHQNYERFGSEAATGRSQISFNSFSLVNLFN